MYICISACCSRIVELCPSRELLPFRALRICSMTRVKLTFADAGCGDPGTPVNGVRDTNSTKVGTEMTFACNKGYRLVGLPMISCVRNGNWTGSIPKCEGIFVCLLPQVSPISPSRSRKQKSKCCIISCHNVHRLRVRC